MPLVPWLALCCDAALMAQLPAAAWVRLGVVTACLLAMASRRERSRRDASNFGHTDGSGGLLEEQGIVCCSDDGHGPDSKFEGRQQLLSDEKKIRS